ncbi:MAG: hypothetical protein MUF49_01765 [Oculatellaceae cyanobacterium Prado106]|jgi:hypothetical protein|nr:hypothetical protein [Oculatellaceae cyanobacterium Prado106]
MSNIPDRNYAKPGFSFNSFLIGVLTTIILGLLGIGFFLFKTPGLLDRLTSQPAVPAQDSARNTNSAVLPAATSETADPAAPQNPGVAAPVAAPNAGSQDNLNIVVRHANGTTLTVNSLTLGSDTITVGFSAINGHGEMIRLNDSGKPDNGLILKDNLGNQYNFAVPTPNGKLEISPGTTLKGQFVFLGKLDPAATSLTLVTNAQFGGDQDFINTPKIEASIPVKRG